MQFGYCLGLDFFQKNGEKTLFDMVADAGYDYVELPLSGISALSGNQLLQCEKALSRIPCRACNLFFPPGLVIVGEGMNISGIRAYLAKMLPIAAGLGVETLVFGNGGARKIPEGAIRENIWNNLRTLIEIMDEYTGRYGVTICVEPLNATETNIITSYGEAARLTAGLSQVTTMIDNYHVAMEGQSFDDVLASPEQLKHLHIAYPDGRLVPSAEDDVAKYAAFLRVVKQLGYDDKISIEGRLRATESDDMYHEVAGALCVLKKLVLA